MKSFVQKSERSYVWKEMQQWLKSIQLEDIKLKPIGSPIFLIYHSKIQEYDSSHHKQTMLLTRFSNKFNRWLAPTVGIKLKTWLWDQIS